MAICASICHVRKQSVSNEIHLWCFWHLAPLWASKVSLLINVIINIMLEKPVSHSAAVSNTSTRIMQISTYVCISVKRNWYEKDWKDFKGGHFLGRILPKGATGRHSSPIHQRKFWTTSALSLPGKAGIKLLVQQHRHLWKYGQHTTYQTK